MPRCGIVILAAGGSSRMGRPKQLLEFEGTTLLQRAVRTALGSVCRPVVVVLGAGANVLQTSLLDLPVTVVINDQWQLGMGTSIRRGLTAVQTKPVDAAMIFLCDQPLITTAVLDQMIDQHFAGGKAISAAFYGGTHGTPAVFDGSLFGELLSIEDGQGGKVVINRHLDQVRSVDLAEGEIDVDTPADFERLSWPHPR